MRRNEWQRLGLDFSDLSSQVAVLAAHPDDETIGASALIANCPRSFVFYLTDGAPRNPDLRPVEFKSCKREEYAAVRRAEAENALGIAGIQAQQIEWLAGIDQEAIFEISKLTNDLANLLNRHGIGVLITHPYEGGHPDHDAAALIAHLAAMQAETDCRLLEMTSYHARGSACETGTFLNSSQSAEITVELSQEDRIRKRKMIDAYFSQRLVLEAFPIEREKYRHAPEYDFSKAPHSGALWYEQMSWMTGERWRSLAKEAVVAAQEHHAANRA